MSNEWTREWMHRSRDVTDIPPPCHGCITQARVLWHLLVFLNSVHILGWHSLPHVQSTLAIPRSMIPLAVLCPEDTGWTRTCALDSQPTLHSCKEDRPCLLREEKQVTCWTCGRLVDGGEVPLKSSYARVSERCLDWLIMSAPAGKEGAGVPLQEPQVSPAPARLDYLPSVFSLLQRTLPLFLPTSNFFSYLKDFSLPQVSLYFLTKKSTLIGAGKYYQSNNDIFTRKRKTLSFVFKICGFYFAHKSSSYFW